MIRDAATGIEERTHDGRPQCALCSHEASPEQFIWCAVVSALVCPGCCRGVTHFVPDSMVAALSRTGVAITPDEVFTMCSDCAANRTHGTGESLPT